MSIKNVWKTMLKLIFLFLLIASMFLKAAQEEKLYQEKLQISHNKELVEIRNKLLYLDENLSKLKVFQRRTGKLSSQGVILFESIFNALEVFEEHNNSLFGRPNIITINQDEFWQLPEIIGIDFFKDIQKKAINLSIDDTKLIKFIGILGNLTPQGYFKLEHIYLNIQRIMYYIIKECARINLNDRLLVFYYHSYERIISFKNMSKILSGRLDYMGRMFIESTLKKLISIYDRYLVYLEHNFQ